MENFIFRAVLVNLLPVEDGVTNNFSSKIPSGNATKSRQNNKWGKITLTILGTVIKKISRN